MKPLCDQIAEAMWESIPNELHTGGVFNAINKAADAAIKVIDEVRRCRTCKLCVDVGGHGGGMDKLEGGYCEIITLKVPGHFGCNYWKEKS